MRLKKCLVILPLLALTLSGCNDTVVSETTSESESSEASSTSKEEVTELHNYTLNINLIYGGTTVQVPSYISLYVYGNLTGNEYKALDSDNKVTIETINVGSQGFTLYGAYTDSSDYTQLSDRVSFEVESSQGDNYINNIDVPLLDSLDNLLPPLTEGGEGEESSESTTENPGTGEGSSGDSSSGSGSGNPEEPGAGESSSSSENPGAGEGSSSDSSSGSGSGNPKEPETWSYSIKVENVTDNKIELSYDQDKGDSQEGFELQIKLVSVSSLGETVEEDATENNVMFTGYDTSLIVFSGLTVYPLAPSSEGTTFTISWTPENTETVTCDPISVTIIDNTEYASPSDTLNNYTLRFTFWYEESVETAPEYADLYISGSWNEWSYEKLTKVDSSYEYYFTSIANTNEKDWYSYNLALAYNSVSEVYYDNSYALTISSPEYCTFEVTGLEGDNYTNPICVTLSTSMADTIPAPVDTVTLTVTITTADTVVQTLPEWADLYIEGSWNNSEETSYNVFEKMTPNESRNAFTLELSGLNPDWYTYSLVLAKAGTSESEVTWSNYVYQITQENNYEGSFEIKAGSSSAESTFVSTQSLDTFTDPETKVVETAEYFTLTLNLKYQSSAYTLNEGLSIYIQGDWGEYPDVNSGWTDPIEMSPDTARTSFSTTISSLSIEEHHYTVYYNYSGLTSFGNDDWNLKLGDGITLSADNIASNTTYTTDLDFSVDINSELSTGSGSDWPSGESITLTFSFTYDYSVETLEEYEQIYIIGGWDDATWNDDDAKLLTLNEDNQTYSVEITYGNGEDVMNAHYYGFNLILTEKDAAYSWNDDTKLSSSNLYWSYQDEPASLTKTYEIELSKPFADYIDDPNSIVIRENCVVTYYFVDNAENPETYYSIPSYADAYVTGYFDYDENGAEVWTDYTIGGNTKLSAVGGAASNGYSVTISKLHSGTVTYNMYFEYNENVTNHEAATGATWNANHAIADKTNNTTMYIPATGDCKVYLELDPSTLIIDDLSYCSLTIGLKDSSSPATSKSFKIAFSDWATHDMSTSSGSYEYYYTNDSVELNQSCTFTIFTLDNWNDKLQPPSGDSNFSTDDGNIVIAASVMAYEQTTIIFTVNFSSFGSGSWVYASSTTITHG